ncbi:MAG: hydroxyacid dehydrogenase [Firmicutes bacterium]|nr:hydroxyacid dehydrogenase [Bacillota bacterium]
MILVTEWLDPEALALLNTLSWPNRYDPEAWQDPQRLAQHMAEAEGLVVRNATQVTAALLEAAPRLKVIGRLGVGLDNIDLEACQAHRVSVVYARGANAISVVEYVLGALLFSFRPWLTWVQETKDGFWNRSHSGRELHGKTLGVVGLGDIGSRVARAARFLGMVVEGYDPHLAPFHALIADNTVMPQASLEDLVARADAITLHAPLRPENAHLLNRDTFRALKPGAVLINTARGGLIDEAALLAALQESRLGPVFLDVREQEPPAIPDPLAAFPNVYLTPHIAGLTVESHARTTRLVLEDVVRVLTGRPPRSPVRWPAH